MRDRRNGSHKAIRHELDRETLAPALKAAFDINEAGPEPECFDALLRRIK